MPDSNNQQRSKKIFVKRNNSKDDFFEDAVKPVANNSLLLKPHKDDRQNKNEKYIYTLSEEEILVDSEITQLDVKTQVVTDTQRVTLPNGQIEIRQVNKTLKRIPSFRFKTVKRFWPIGVRFSTVIPIVSIFAQKYGPELTEAQLTLFNAIAATDRLDFNNQYRYFNVRLEDFGDSLKESARILDSEIATQTVLLLE